MSQSTPVFELLETIQENIQLSKDEIIKKCGYVLDKKNLDYVSFYDDLSRELEHDEIETNSVFFYQELMERGSLFTPILDKEGIIVGRDVLIIAPAVVDIMKKWTEKEWLDEENSDQFGGPFETGNPNGSKGYYYPHFNIESAVGNFSGDLSQILRPAYRNLTSEYETRTLQEFLSEYGEHPQELINLIDRWCDSVDV